MISARLGMLSLLVLAPAFAQVSVMDKKADHQFGPIKDKLDHSDGTADSTNWSGYAVLGSSFTSAEGSWTVPGTVCSSGRGSNNETYAAFWVGLDGFSSNTVEQTGTLTECVNGRAYYYAWYEFYPNPSIEIPIAVNPGNVISASVTYANGTFTTTLTNISTGRSYSKSMSVTGAARSSAEWIAEAPCCTNSGGILPLADFGTVSFGSDYTKVSGTNGATSSTVSGPISAFGSNVYEINKVGASSSPQLSSCSVLSSDGTSFTCTWQQ